MHEGICHVNESTNEKESSSEKNQFESAGRDPFCERDELQHRVGQGLTYQPKLLRPKMPSKFHGFIQLANFQVLGRKNDYC